MENHAASHQQAPARPNGQFVDRQAPTGPRLPVGRAPEPPTRNPEEPNFKPDLPMLSNQTSQFFSIG